MTPTKIIIIIIINKQITSILKIQKVVTTTAKNTKISHNSPARKCPVNAPSPQTLGRIAPPENQAKLPHPAQ